MKNSNHRFEGQPTMQWEYKVHVQWFSGWTRQGRAKKIEDLCNRFGLEGWQLTNVQNGDPLGLWGFDLVFKRPASAKEVDVEQPGAPRIPDGE